MNNEVNEKENLHNPQLALDACMDTHVSIVSDCYEVVLEAN